MPKPKMQIAVLEQRTKNNPGELPMKQTPETKIVRDRYRATHKKEISENGKLYRETHKKEIEEYRKTHAAEIKQQRIKYRAEHKEEIALSKRLYEKTHPDKKRAWEKAYTEKHMKTVICEYCGKSAQVTKQSTGKFCSNDCSSKYYCGPNSHYWQGGISFEPYCPKWNEDIRIRIRQFFGDKCILCGKSHEENVKNLSCHHIEYNKQACCDGKPVQFAALCISCHQKTNFDRARWEAMLHRIIDEIYGGRSYYTKEEWEALRRKT
jgi:hypothetical protein